MNKADKEAKRRVDLTSGLAQLLLEHDMAGGLLLAVDAQARMVVIAVTPKGQQHDMPVVMLRAALERLEGGGAWDVGGPVPKRMD